MSLLRRRRPLPPPPQPQHIDGSGASAAAVFEEKENKEKKATGKKEVKARWSCWDSCCWLIGCICTLWWLLLFLYNAMPPSFPQYVTEAITGPMSDPPGLKLRKEGLRARHPVVFVPGIVTGGLELWEGHHCADGLFRKRLWGGTFGEIYKRYSPLESIFPITCLFVPLSLIGNEGWFGKDCLQLKWRNGTYILKFFLLSIMNSMFYKCKMTCDLSSCFRLPSAELYGTYCS